MTALQKVSLGTAPAGSDGDPVRAAFVKANSNVDVLSNQAALTSAPQIGAAQALTASHIGKRVNINLASAGTINMPPLSALTDQDGVVLLRNLGSTVVTLAAAVGTNDWMGLSKLNPGEVVLMDGFANGWNVLMRSRTRLDNEIVNGSLTVGGGITGNLPVSGKVNAVNGANLLLNGSAEFGGWGGFVGAYNSGTAEGTFLSNPAALTAASYAGSTSIAMAAGVTLTISGEIYAGGVSSGSTWFRIVFINSSGGVVTVSPNVAAAPGAGWTFGSYTVTTPAGTATVYVQIGVEAGTNGVSVASGGVAWRRLKLEKGGAPSLYSQEASIAYLQGAPALSGRPTFAGNTPWDSGNFTPANKLTKSVSASNFVNNAEAAAAAPASNIYDLGTFSTPTDGAAGQAGIANGGCYVGPQGTATTASNWYAFLRVVRVSDSAVIVAGNPGGLVTWTSGSAAFALSCSVAFSGLTANTAYKLQLVVVSSANPGVATNVGYRNASMLLF